MQRDAVVDDVRKVRRAIEAECGSDPRKYYEHLIELQEKDKQRLVRRAPRPALAARREAV
ncbi:MAG: hypothetical protein ACYC9Y_05945 [Candidatus Methylomirabilia bacterium]